MNYTNKDLFAIALGHFICNVEDVLEDILERDEWDEVIIAESFENLEVNDIHEMVVSLQEDFIKIRDSK